MEDEATNLVDTVPDRGTARPAARAPTRGVLKITVLLLRSWLLGAGTSRVRGQCQAALPHPSSASSA